MRRLLTGLVVAATTTAVPMLASAGNQEVANQIADTLRDSGQLDNYKIAVKYQDDTAWLAGRVQSQGQMNSALRLVLQTPGVTRVINQLTLGPPKEAEPTVADPLPTRTSLSFGAVGTGPTPIRSPQIGAAERLRKIIASQDRGATGRRAVRPATGRRVGRAQRVPSSVPQTPVRQVSVTGEVVGPQEAAPRVARAGAYGRPIPAAYTQPAAAVPGGPLPAYVAGVGGGVAPARYDQPHLPNYSWPSYAAYPNYAGLTYPRQYSPTAWPFIGPFYPYPQVPLGWRKVTLEWDDGWWMLDFKD